MTDGEQAAYLEKDRQYIAAQKRLEAAEQTIAKLVEAAEVVNTKACWDRVLAHAILEAKQFLEQP